MRIRITDQSTRAALATALFSLAIGTPPLAAQDVAIRNATIITITNGDIQNGTIVVRNGKISAVGQNVSIPVGIRVIDGTGTFVMPGIIDAHSHAALENGINEGAESVTPEVQVQLKNDDPVIYRALAGGVTAANLLHGSANTDTSATVLASSSSESAVSSFPVIARRSLLIPSSAAMTAAVRG